MVSGQEIVKAADGMPAILQGSWSNSKLYFLEYFDSIFTTGMKNRWPRRAYVDLQAGPGICVDRATNREFHGSALRAMACKNPFTDLFLNDINPEFVTALEKRQQSLFPDANAIYSVNDCNLACREIRDLLPADALALIFADPWNYELTFDGLETLASRPFTDLVVTFHTQAIKRNAHLTLGSVDRFLGDNNWRTRYWAAGSDVTTSGTKVLIDTFQANLKNRLGYRYFGNPVPVKNDQNAVIFYLVFASKNPKGLDFWEKSTSKAASGQLSFSI